MGEARWCAADQRELWFASAGDLKVLDLEMEVVRPVRAVPGTMRGLAIDETSVYWSDGDAVVKAPRVGGEPEVLFRAAEAGRVGTLAYADGAIYCVYDQRLLRLVVHERRPASGAVDSDEKSA